jgi:hypothetical protein
MGIKIKIIQKEVATSISVLRDRNCIAYFPVMELNSKLKFALVVIWLGGLNELEKHRRRL